MTRLQKKCFLFSAGLHGLLLVILLAGSAFSDKPAQRDIPILTMIPANIVDAAGAGGGSPAPAVAPQTPQPLQLPQPASPVVQHQTPAIQQPMPQPVERAKPVERTQPREPVTEPTEPATQPKKTSAKPTHEIHPDYTPATSANQKSKPKTSATPSGDSSSRADARRLRQQLARFADAAADSVRSSAAEGTVVDMPGQGGGQAFAGYETIIYNAYYHAWTTPDGVANKLAKADVKIVVARDGTIISAEIVNKSGESALDKSVERALRAVTQLPPFPESAHDEQRSFLIRFNLEAKEGSG